MRSSALISLAVALAAARAAEPVTLLLVDDHEVLQRAGTVRVLQSPARRAPPVLVPDRPWEGAIAYCSAHRDAATGRYQLWYQAYGAGAGGKVCYAESADGIAWTKPALDLHPHPGAARTNIVLPGGSESYGAAALFDPRETDPARRYKMAKWEMPNGPVAPWPGLYVAFSPDGIRWTRYAAPGSPPPVPRGHFDLAQRPLLHGSYARRGPPPFAGDPAHTTGESVSVSDVIDVAWDPPRGCFMLYAKTWIDGPDGAYWKRSVVRTESRDFIHWSPPRLVLAPDEFDGVRPGAYGGSRTGVQLHGGPVFWRHGVYFCLLQVVDYERTGEMPVELALSRDGYAWSRPFRGRPFMPVRPGRNFDAGWIMSNATPVVLADEIRFYYGAYESLWNAGSTAAKGSGIGLATLPLDRFVALRPQDRIGQVTLRARDLSGFAALTLNADASGGAIRVELLDAEGYRIRGHTRDDAVPLRGDSLRHAVAWHGNPSGRLPPGAHQIRVHLDNAELFAVTLQ